MAEVGGKEERALGRTTPGKASLRSLGCRRKRNFQAAFVVQLCAAQNKSPQDATGTVVRVQGGTESFSPPTCMRRGAHTAGESSKALSHQKIGQPEDGKGSCGEEGIVTVPESVE